MIEIYDIFLNLNYLNNTYDIILYNKKSDIRKNFFISRLWTVKFPKPQNSASNGKYLLRSWLYHW